MNALIFTALFILGLPFLVSFLWRKYRFARIINKIPGPDGRFIFGNALEILNISPDKRLDHVSEYMKKYGSLVRLWLGLQPLIIVADAKYIETILSSRVNMDKSVIYEFLQPWIGTGLITSSGAKWVERRKLLTPTFHFSILNSFLGTIIDSCDTFLRKMQAEVLSDEFDVYPYVNNCTLDIICETAMGVKVNAQDGTSEYLNAVKTMSQIVIKRLFRPWLWPEFFYSFTQEYKKQQEILLIIHKFTLDVIKKKRMERESKRESGGQDKLDASEDGSTVKKAFLDLLLDISEQNGVTFTDADIMEETDTFMFAGHDTVSSALSWAIYQIGLYTDVQEKIFEELSSIFGTSQRHPTLNDIMRLKYLESVIKECMRLYPSVPAVQRIVTNAVRLGDNEIPVGSILEIGIYLLHRNPRYYKEPDKFEPDRFSSENCLTLHPYAFIPFSAGSRNCIGQKFAMLEMKVFLSSLLRRYEIKSLQTVEEVTKIPDLVMHPGNGIKIKIFERKYAA